MGVLEVEEQVSLVEGTGDPPLPIMGGSAVLSFEQQKELIQRDPETFLCLSVWLMLGSGLSPFAV